MKLLVLGHLCIDCSHPAGEPPRERWGGIANAIAAIGALAGGGDSVLPVCGVGKGDEQRFLSWLKRFPAVDPSGVFALDGPTNRIEIYEKGKGLSVACTKDVAPPVPFEKIRRFLSADGILINMVSGSDISLATLDQIRMEVRARETPVHLDFHNLTTEIGRERERFRRPLEEWRRWAFMVTTVQMSEEEASGLAVDRLAEQQLVGHLLTLGVSGVIITRGARGATLFVNEHKKVVRHDIAGIPAEGASVRMGLGDVFGGAFLYRFVSTSDMMGSAEFANQTAALAASRPAGAAADEEWISPG
ncbi:MAG TPA: carbohydrate kinase family protein [Bacteroidota bacterium]|nr:carbohydrate kinase family protein [Bacteroidota bacterium]